MDQIFKALAAHDEVYAEVAGALFGDGAYELVAKAQNDQKSRRERTMQNVAIGTNVVGSVAGPAALYSAVKNRKGGGIPRDVADSVGRKMSGSPRLKVKRVGEKINAGVNALNNPATKRNKRLAVAAGGTMVGLQAVNWGGDALSAKLINDQKKKQQKVVAKAMPDAADLHVRGPMGRAKVVARVVDDPKVRAKGKRLADETKIRSVKITDASLDVAAKGRQKVSSRIKKDNAAADDVTWYGEFSKVDTDKRQAFGYASIIELNGEPVVDRQNDYIGPEELENAAYDYVIKSRKGGDMHRRVGDQPFHGADLIESFVITDEKVEKMGLPPETPRGWWVGYKVHDDELWGEIKKGNRKGFSIHGKGIRKDMHI